MYGVPGLVDARLYSTSIRDLPMTMTPSRRKARSSMGSRTSRRQGTKKGATTMVDGRKIKQTRPRPRSRIERIIRGQKA